MISIKTPGNRHLHPALKMVLKTCYNQESGSQATDTTRGFQPPVLEVHLERATSSIQQVSITNNTLTDNPEVHREQEPPIKNEDRQPYQMRYRWVMLALVWLLYFCFGLFMRSISPLVTPILEDLGISYSQMGVILGASPLLYIVVAAIGGALIDRWGIRKCLFAGIIIVGLSEILRYFANGFATMFLCVALLGLGAPMISIGSPKTVSLWFRGKERATAVGIYMTGPSIGGLIAYSLTNSVVMPLTGYSWRLTFVSFSLIAFTAALLWWLLAKDVSPAEPAETEEKIGIISVFKGLAGIRNVQLILILGFLSLCTAHGFSDWLPKILETGGLPPAIAGFAASIPVIVGMPIVLFIPRVVPPHLRGRVIALMAIVGIIPLIMIPITSGAPLIVGLVLSGTKTLAGVPLLMLIFMDMPEVGSKYMGAAAGMFFCISPIGQIVGPWIMGYLVDVTGGFLAGSAVLAGLSLVMAITALMLKTNPAPETKLSS